MSLSSPPPISTSCSPRRANYRRYTSCSNHFVPFNKVPLSTHSFPKPTSPSPPVTTRTNGLTPVTHPSFNVRFSALSDVENACKEDDEERSARTIDWIGTRIAQQASGWLENPRMVEHERWWTELRACAEGERAPVRGEGWNHPVACM